MALQPGGVGTVGGDVLLFDLATVPPQVICKTIISDSEEVIQQQLTLVELVEGYAYLFDIMSASHRAHHASVSQFCVQSEK